MNVKKLTSSLLLFLAAIFSLMAQKPTTTSNTSDEWEIRWSASDEFNGDTLNWSKWIQSGSALPNTTAWKWDNAANVTLENGVAELKMRQNVNNASDGGTYFKSGILKSYQTFTYGYYEARIKGASIGEGVCPSFWLYSNFDYTVANGQTVYSEIDVVELQQFDWYEGHQDDIRDMDHNLHAVVMENGNGVWRRPKQHPEAQLSKWRAPWDPRNDYHIYGCEVNESEIIWYVDGVEVARKSNTYWYRPMNVTLSLGLRKPFVEFYNNRNNAINPETNATANAALPGMPTSMFVDYVRVWEKTGTSTNPPVGTGSIGNPSFESGDLNYWNAGSGNQTVENNNAQAGSKSGKIVNASIAQIITLKANTDYTITAYGKVAVGTNSAFVGVNDGATNALIQNFEFTGTNYQKATLSLTTSTTEKSYKVWFWSSGTAYCDNFQITEGGSGGSPGINVTGVSLNKSSLSLDVNETSNLSATVAPNNATNKAVTWSTNNNAVASVNNSGVVTAKSAGNAIITVTTTDGNKKAICSVVVTNSSTGGGGSSGVPQVGQIIWIKSSEGKYLTMNNGASTAIQATGATLGVNQQFRVVDGNGYLGLESMGNNKYVTATSLTNTPLRCGSKGVWNRQKFTIISVGSDEIALKAMINGLFCSARLSDANRPVQVMSSSVQVWETFTWGTVGSARILNDSNKAAAFFNTSLYPNPVTNGAFKVDFGMETSYQIQVLDLKGQLIYSVGGNGTQQNISVQEAGLKQGLYFLKIETRYENSVQKLMIK